MSYNRAVATAPVDLLERVPLFSGLNRRELERLAGSMKERAFQKGDTLTTEGRGGVGFFVIEEGEADVTVQGEERAKLGPGDYFGEIALIAETDRTATITAETDMRCYGMTMWDFRPLVESNASIAWNMLQALAKKLREAERQQT
jgi:CRP/FNR family cyclic AMP-dependent transcriptional regulator